MILIIGLLGDRSGRVGLGILLNCNRGKPTQAETALDFLQW